MTKKEKTALLEAGNKALEELDGYFEQYLQERNFDVSSYMRAKFDGAAQMLAAIGLISYDDAFDRSSRLFGREMDALRGSRQKDGSK